MVIATKAIVGGTTNGDMMKTYRVVDYTNNTEYTGYRGRRYTDLAIARFWAKQKSDETNSVVALVSEGSILNLYLKGKTVKGSDIDPDFILTFTRKYRDGE